MGRSGPATKPFEIPKRLIVQAWGKVRANAGSAGVDAVSIKTFETDLRGNLYRIWNRMSSGSYFPMPVRAVEIPKADGSVRTLGVPTVADRVAQTAVCLWLEEKLEPIFHPDSYGYRPNRSALDAVGVCRKRCWSHDWVIDLDIRAFFDSVDHELLMAAVSHHTHEKWVLLYVQRWLIAPLQRDGELVERDRGTPQGAPISPLLANLFMHYAFDRWMARNHRDCLFERYADDAVIHCQSEAQAEKVLAELSERMMSLKLELHPAKTKIVYCQDANRPGDAKHTRFDFLGYTFKARPVRGKRGMFMGFVPAMSDRARTDIGKEIRNWHLARRSGTDLEGLAASINPQLRGWINYFGAFHRSQLIILLRRIDQHLVRWACQKYKRFRWKPHAARAWLEKVRLHHPNLFAHWQSLPVGRPVGAV